MNPTHLLRFWGRDKAIAEALLPQHVERMNEDRGATAAWFASAEERDAFMDQARSATECLMMAPQDGPFTRSRTVALFTLSYNGKSYDLECDFGFGYEPEAAEYMFYEGNYSCDDNRSLFIIRGADPTFPEHGCGDAIKMTQFRVERRPLPTRTS